MLCQCPELSLNIETSGLIYSNFYLQEDRALPVRRAELEESVASQSEEEKALQQLYR